MKEIDGCNDLVVGNVPMGEFIQERNNLILPLRMLVNGHEEQILVVDLHILKMFIKDF